MRTNRGELNGQPDYSVPRTRFRVEQKAANVIALGTRIVEADLDPTLPFIKVWIACHVTFQAGTVFRARVNFLYKSQQLPDLEFPLDSADSTYAHATQSPAFVSAFTRGTGSPSENMLLTQIQIPGAASIGAANGLVSKNIYAIADKMRITVTEISSSTVATILPAIQQSNFPW